MTSGPVFNAGEIFETGVWAKDAAAVARARELMPLYFGAVATTHGLVFGDVTIELYSKDHPRAPKPPEGETFVAAWAEVKCVLPRATPSAFAWVQELDTADRARLRDLTRDLYRRLRPAEPNLTDYETDIVIAAKGHDMAERMLLAAVDGKAVN